MTLTSPYGAHQLRKRHHGAARGEKFQLSAKKRDIHMFTAAVSQAIAIVVAVDTAKLSPAASAPIYV